MKYAFFIILILPGLVCSNKQVGDIINLTITIDNSIVTNTDMLKVIINKKTGSDTLSATYNPGKLIINAQGLNKIPDEINSIVIEFTYNKYFKGKRKDYSYQIPLPSDAILQDFNIINIFNLDNPANGKAFYPTNEKKYVFDYLYPGGGRLTKRI